MHVIIAKLSKEIRRSTELDLQKINCSQFERASENIETRRSICSYIVVA